MQRLLERLFRVNKTGFASADSPASTKAIAAYADFVRAQATTNEPALNHLPEHTAIVVGVLFDRARKNVEILTDELDRSVYGKAGVIDAVVRFLRKSPEARIEIITDKDITASHPLIAAVRKEGLQDRLELSCVPAAMDGISEFIVADGQDYRCQCQPAPHNLQGLFRFNDAEMGQKLRLVFNLIKSESCPVPIAAAGTLPFRDADSPLL